MRLATPLRLAALPLGAALLIPAAAGARPDGDRGDPFTMSAGRVTCRNGHVLVTLHNRTRQRARFDLRSDSNSVATGSIPARKSVTRIISVERGGSTEIEAYSVSDDDPDTLIDSTWVRNECRRRHGRGSLPRTGPPADLMGKLATGTGVMLTGATLWWYGSLWPRGSRPH
jgi:hypothetical protein